MTEEREENEERGEPESPESAGGPEEPESTGDPELDRQVASLQGENDRVGQEIEDARRDWEAKQDDPGATPPEDEEDEGEEEEDEGAEEEQ